MNDVHESSGVLVLPDGRVLVVGGHRVDKTWTLVNTVELYDPTADQWTKSTPALETREGVRAMHLLRDGRVLMAGEHNTLTGSELFDPSTEQWTATGALNVGRGAHGSARLEDGRVLVAGGINWLDAATPCFDSAELYDPATGSWRMTTAMTKRRSGPLVVPLASGRVLVMGGHEEATDGSPFARSGEIYDPATEVWMPIAEAPRNLGNAGVVRLRDGRVLIAGGTTATGGKDSSSARAELYDPVTDRWSQTGSMAAARSQFPLVLLEDGRALAVGGVARPEPRALAEVEVFDPETETWSSAGRLTVPRWNHAVVRLPTGILVVGGYNGTDKQLSSVELNDRL